MGKRKPLLSLQLTITLLVCGVVALALIVTNVLLHKQLSENVEKRLAQEATNIARMTAHSPLVVDTLNRQRDSTDVQDFASEMQHLTGVRFIVVMDMNGIRLSHPDPSKIGQHFVGGDETEVLKGREHISVAEGTLGMSLRAFTPVVSPAGKQVGAVAVGISLEDVQQAIVESRDILYLGIGLGGLVGLIGALFLARKIKKILFGLEPFAIAKILQERSAMLQSTKEGIIAIDDKARITLANEEAIRLLKRAGIDEDPIGKSVEVLIPSTHLTTVLETGVAALDQEQDLHGISILTNRVPIRVGDRIVGAMATFRDKTEIRQLAEQLTGTRLYAEALRAQAHEFMNKLHVILGMVHMKYYDQLSEYVRSIAQHHQTEVGMMVRKVRDPVLAGFILAKLSYAREMGAELIISGDGTIPEPKVQQVTHELVTILGNLLDNALDAVQGRPKKQVELHLDYEDGLLTVEVSDTGPGISDEAKARIFTKGFSTKGTNRGLGLYLVQRSLNQLNGTMEIESREAKGSRFILQLPYESKGEME